MDNDPFVEEHKKEIEEMAYKIYEMRAHYLQPDNPVANFNMAISIIKRQYQEMESHSAQ